MNGRAERSTAICACIQSAICSISLAGSTGAWCFQLRGQAPCGNADVTGTARQQDHHISMLHDITYGVVSSIQHHVTLQILDGRMHRQCLNGKGGCHTGLCMLSPHGTLQHMHWIPDCVNQGQLPLIKSHVQCCAQRDAESSPICVLDSDKARVLPKRQTNPGSCLFKRMLQAQ